jgi:hypothetical protein
VRPPRLFLLLVAKLQDLGDGPDFLWHSFWIIRWR